MNTQEVQRFLNFSRDIIQKYEFQKSVDKNQILGTIYTPKNIVDYIVSNIFRLYFEDFVEIKELFGNEYFLEFTNSKFRENRDLQKKLIKKIENIKILDPACGSGRFLISIAEYLFKIYKFLDINQKEYDIKEYIIKNNLYGIEIEKSACLISKLNLLSWLISNSDFNIKKVNTYSLKFENVQKIIEKSNLEFNINNSDYLLEFNGKQFDIIVGNPPYIENKKIKNIKYKKKLIKTFNSAYGLFDISVLFLEKSVQLLKQKIGCFSFLTTNKFLSADYGVKIREILLNNTEIKEIINISSLPIFRKTSAYPIIISTKKVNPRNKNSILIKKFKNIDDITKNNLLKIINVSQNWIKDFPAKVFPVSGNINVLKYLYDNFKPLSEIIKNYKIIYRPFGFINWSKFFDNIKERKDNEEDLLLIGTGNVGKYHIKFDKELKIAKRKVEISYFNANLNFGKIWKELLNEKLIFREIAKDLTWVYDPGIYVNITGLYSLRIPSYKTNKLFCLLTIMNSELMDQIFKTLFSSLHMSGNYLRFNGSFIKRLPLPNEFPQSLSNIGKIIQILSQINYDLNSISLKFPKFSPIFEIKKKFHPLIQKDLPFYKYLANSLTNLLYFRNLISNSNISYNILLDLLFEEDFIPSLKFKFIFPRFNLSNLKVYQIGELESLLSKISSCYQNLIQNKKLLLEMKKISYKSLFSNRKWDIFN